MFNFEHIKLTQTQFKQLAKLFLGYKHCYVKFDQGKMKLELNFRLSNFEDNSSI